MVTFGDIDKAIDMIGEIFKEVNASSSRPLAT